MLKKLFNFQSLSVQNNGDAYFNSFALFVVYFLMHSKIFANYTPPFIDKTTFMAINDFVIPLCAVILVLVNSLRSAALPLLALLVSGIFLLLGLKAEFYFMFTLAFFGTCFFVLLGRR